MAKADIGVCDCPICRKSGAHVRVTERGKSYIYCDDCEVQIFARGVVSDALIRERAGLAAALKPAIPAPAQPAEKAPAKVKATVHTADGKTEQKEIEQPGPAANETTIFDIAMGLFK